MQGFQQFTRERQYLHNVSPRTVEWYANSLRWLPSETPSQDELNETVLRMRERGLKATGCNCAIRAINAYLKWSSSPLKIRPLKEPSLCSRPSQTRTSSGLSSGSPRAITRAGCISSRYSC
jgi:hypothetical protein